MNLNNFKMSSISKGILSDYTINSTLGKGTFSTVKLATNKRTNEKIAIKILEKNKIKTTRDFNRINREINIAKNINHLNIVQFLEIKEDSDKYYILMEYCENGELFDLILSKKKLSEDEAAYYFYQLVNGLEYIHMNNIIHRDLKPENLLLTKNNILKIIDFGLSNYNPEDNLLTTPCGSPCYASPEMVSGKKYNGITNDVWSIGIILYAMIYGYLPFENENGNNELLFRRIRECKIDYPQNNCVMALDLLKKILVRDFNERITINEIKNHKFYLKGKFLFRRKHREIKDENKFHLKEVKVKKIFKKNNFAELNSRLIGLNDNEYNLLKKRSFNINITDDNKKQSHKIIFYNKNKTNIFPETIIKINHNNNKYKNKAKQIFNKKRNYFSTLTTNFNNKTNRDSINYNIYNINNKTEINFNPKNNYSLTKRDTNNISLNRSNLDKTPKIKSKRTINLLDKDLYPISQLINYSDKFPDFNSFSTEKENDIFKKPFSEIKLKKIKEKKENYLTSEIRKLISDKNRIKISQKNKELKPISFKDLKQKKIHKVNIVSLDKNEFKKNYIKKYGTTKMKLEKKNYDENFKNKEHKDNNNIYNNLYLNNDFFNISNENNKYNNTTYAPNLTSRLINKKPKNNKYIINFNNNRINKYSEDKINSKSNNNINRRLDTNLINNKLIKSYIEIPNKNNNFKKISLSNLQNDIINNSSIISENNSTDRKHNIRSNILNITEKEKSMEKEKEEFINKSVIDVKNYKLKNNKYEYAKFERNKNNHETFVYKHVNNANYKNDYLNNGFKYNRHLGMKKKEKEEISKINNSYDNDIKLNRNLRINNELNINISKFKMTNLPSITIDMNVLNKNNIKYLKLYDAIKNKL